ncbi:hypothetical protein D3C76_1836790 [compost metagenome]
MSRSQFNDGALQAEQCVVGSFQCQLHGFQALALSYDKGFQFGEFLGLFRHVLLLRM